MRRRVVIGPDTKMVRLGGRPPRLLIVLLAIQGAIFLLYAFADGPAWVREHLALSAGRALGLFELWQPLTAPWVHLELRSALVNCLSLWVFGTALYRWWGGRRFFAFYAVTGVLGMALALAVGLLWPLQPVAGSGGAAIALMIATAVLFPQHLIYFYGVLPLRAKWLGLLTAGFLVIGAIIAGSWLELALQLGGAMGALLFLFGPRRMIARAQLRRAKRRYKVIDGGKKDNGPTYLN